MHKKKHLSFTALREELSKQLLKMGDKRDQSRIKYSIHDCFMSGFAMMFFQDPSLLSFQERMKEKYNRSNLETVFKVKAIPKDSQLREVIDDSDFDKIEEVFSKYFKALQRGKHLESYKFLGGKYLITIDGSEYFSSEKINCPGCLRKESKRGKVRYYHEIVQAALVHPDHRQVIVLAPEQVRNTDGSEKQDCEINAGKRLLHKIRRYHPKLGIIIVADSLYSKQSFIKELKDERMSYILVAKPKDHKLMMEWVSEQKEMGNVSRIEHKDEKGREHVYEWINEVPLNGYKDTFWVNYFEYTILSDNKINYHNSWVTDIHIDRGNIKQLVRGGRSRWKIENETFNTLKNQGYHLEHNFGHGKKNLSINFFLLNLLAFFMHQILELTDILYKKCRAIFSSRKEYWNNLRVIFRIFLFESWEDYLRFFYSPP